MMTSKMFKCQWCDNLFVMEGNHWMHERGCEIKPYAEKIAALEKELIYEKDMRDATKIWVKHWKNEADRLRAVVEAVKEYTTLDHSYCGCVGCRKLYEALWKLDALDRAGGEKS